MAAGVLGSSDCERLLRRIQQHVSQRRIRVGEFFGDFAGLHAGACSGGQFRRALDRIGMNLTIEELEALEGRYRIPGAALMVEISYVDFLREVDRVFPAAPGSQQDPLGSRPQHCSTVRARGIGDDERLKRLLERLLRRCKTRSVDFRSSYAHFERGPSTSAVRITPRRGGKITRTQFIRSFPFADRFDQDEIRFLAEAFTVENGDVHCQGIADALDALDSPTERVDEGFARSGLVLKPDATEWTRSQLDAMEILRAKVVEKRVRLYENFKDFDALRKGTCTLGQLKTVFGLLDLTKELSKEDFDQIAGLFCREDGLFSYRDFCLAAERDFTHPGLEKDPLLKVSLPSARTTSPGRRNHIATNSAVACAVADLHKRIASKIAKLRVSLYPAFRDMDKTRRSHISVSQFERVMGQFDLPLASQEVQLLRTVYCDLGNHVDFNYIEFVKSVEPPSQAEAAVDALRRTPRRTPRGDESGKYFNAVGAVRPLDRTLLNGFGVKA